MLTQNIKYHTMKGNFELSILRDSCAKRCDMFWVSRNYPF